MNVFTTIHIKALCCFLLLCIIWGSTWAVSFIGISEMPVEVLACLRNLLAGIAMLIFFMAKKYPIPSVKQIGQMLLLSFLLFTSNTLLSLYSLQLLPLHYAAIIGCTTPIFIHLLNRRSKKSKISTVFILGCIVSLIGITILVANNFSASNNVSILGIALSLIAVLCWSIGINYINNTKSNINIYYSFAWQLLLSGITIFLYLFFSKTTYSLASISLKGWMSIAYLSFLGSIVAFICLAYTLQHLPESINSLYVFVNAIVAFFISVLFFHTQLIAKDIIAIGCILIGIWISIHLEKYFIQTKILNQ